MLTHHIHMPLYVTGLFLSCVLGFSELRAEQETGENIYGRWQFFATNTWVTFEPGQITIEDKDCRVQVSSTAKITPESYTALSDVTSSGTHRDGSVCSVGLHTDTTYYEIDGDSLYLFTSKAHQKLGKQAAIRLKRETISTGSSQP